MTTTISAGNRIHAAIFSSAAQQTIATNDRGFDFIGKFTSGTVLDTTSVGAVIWDGTNYAIETVDTTLAVKETLVDATTKTYTFNITTDIGTRDYWWAYAPGQIVNIIALNTANGETFSATHGILAANIGNYQISNMISASGTFDFSECGGDKSLSIPAASVPLWFALSSMF